MATREKITLPLGTGMLYGRQPSVTDDDLFGEGRDQNEPTAANQNVIKEDVNDVDRTDNVIPNFGLLGLSSSSENESPRSSSEKNSNFQPIINQEENGEDENQFEILEYKQSPIRYSDGTDSDFKLTYQKSRSVSAIEKRDKYRKSSGGDVFYHDQEYHVGAHFKKSNSLPDLVTCSSQSPLSPPQFNSLPKKQKEVDENLEKQFKLKMALEGASSMPDSKEEKPKVRRTVSIKEEPEYMYIPSDVCDNLDNGDKSAEKQEKASTPTEERRRILSSGYLTGSSEAESQDKSEVTTSRQISQNSHGSSGVWTSQESEDRTDIADDKHTKVIDTQFLTTESNASLEKTSVSPMSSGSGFNDSGSTEGSMNTILDARTYEFVKKTPWEKAFHNSEAQRKPGEQKTEDLGSPKLPNLSIMNNKSLELSASFKWLKSEEENKNEVESESSKEKHTELKPAQSNSGTKSLGSSEPQSYGNLPHISVLESFSLKDSSLLKVHAEDHENYKKVKHRYCGEVAEGSLGAGPSSAGSTSSGRGQSLSNQLSPPEMVRRLEEFLLRVADLSPNVLPEKLQEFRGLNSLTSPLSGDKEKSDTPSSLYFKDVTLEDLERASRCNFPACKENCCLKMQEVFRVLKEDIPYIDNMYRLVGSYYRALRQHVENECSETKCPVLFCSEILDWVNYTSKEPVVDFVRQVQKHLRNPTMKLFQQTSFKFHKLQSRVPKLEMKEFETHIPIFTLGRFGTVQVCMDNHSHKLVILKMYPLLECNHQLSLYRRLKDIEHPNILPHFWLLEYDDKIQVCSLFAQGGSLEDYLSAVGPLPWSRVVKYMMQILSAISHLHTMLGIVYFNWSSGNMLFPDDRRDTIQVGNFSLSCPRGCEWDVGMVKQCLPYHICPPELFDNSYKLDFLSDSWGAGCLLYEMLAGIPVLHLLRHEDQDTVQLRIQNALVGSMPDITSLSQEKRKIFELCWQREMKKRSPVEDVLQYIKTLKVR